MSLRLSVVLIAVETLVVWVFVVVLGFAVSHDNSGFVVREIGFFVPYGVALPLLGWALLRRRRWVRAPLIVIQLLWIGVGWVLSGREPLLGGGIIAVALGCIALLLTPSVRAAIDAQ